MSRRNRFCFIVLITLMAVIGGSCSNTKVRNKPQSLPSPSPVFLEEPVRFCHSSPPPSEKTRVRILVDASGSMVGFKPVVSTFVHWVELGVSQLRGAVEVTEMKTCLFSQAQRGGMFCAASSKSLLDGYQPSSNTNLHDAVGSAREQELTFILTDGVAATGRQGAKDCASGVDASCVAGKLKEVIYSSKDGSGDYGVWILPLLATYDGRFYTEENIRPADFNPTETKQKVKADMRDAVIEDPKPAESDGALTFKYAGPRSLLMIVIAKRAEVGRLAVQSLWEQTASSQVQMEKIEGADFASVSAKLACFTPIELYPGLLEPVKWSKLNEPAEANESAGTIDVKIENRSGRPSIEVGCSSAGGGWTTPSLAGTLPSQGQRSGCVPLLLLPSYTFEVLPAEEKNQEQWDQIHKGYQTDKTQYAQVKMRFSCPEPDRQPAEKFVIAGHYTASVQYGGAEEGIDDENSGATSHKLVRRLSTDHPSLEPHKILAFSTTLKLFYRQIANSQRKIPLVYFDLVYNKPETQSAR